MTIDKAEILNAAQKMPLTRRIGRQVVLALAAAGIAMNFGGHGVRAAPPPVQMPTDESLQSDATSGPFGFVSALPRSNLMLGDMWGLRKELSQYGISFAIQETSEVLGNVTGGIHQGATYDGLTQMILQVDTKRAFGWYGGLLNVSALQVHGRSLSADNLLNLQTASGIEADRATRLWELWYQQKLLPEDRLDIRIGQMSVDQEFIVSQNASYLMNTMFGWPMLPSADLPGGGPAYPLSALGIRFKARPIDPVTILFGVFNGSPVRYNNGDPQMRNPSGTSFPLNGGVLIMGEIQYAYPSLGTMLYADQPEPMARLYKLGFWYNSENFDDLAVDNTGLSLANSASNGLPLSHHGNFSVYAVMDQMLWIDPHENDRTISFFARAMGAPQQDRNLISVSINAGFTFHEPILHRDDDTAAIGMGWAKLSQSASALDMATGAFTGSFTPVRTSETYLEATYQIQVTPWWQVQPDIQYVFNPGGGILNPNVPGATIKNELVLGIRTNILF
jgi:porin